MSTTPTGGAGVPARAVRAPPRQYARSPLQTGRRVSEARAGWERGRTRHRLVLGALGILAVAIVAASVAVSGVLSPAPAQRPLPATPRAWLDAYEAAAIDNPSRVCSELFSPQLARAYGTAVHGSCTSYFARITSFSVIVRRVLRDGDTAVLELRQTVRPRDWAVVLSREPTGWQAVDLLAGDLVR